MADKSSDQTEIKGDVNITDGDFVAGNKTTVYEEEPASAQKKVSGTWIGRLFRRKNQDPDGSITVTGGDFVLGDKISQIFQEILKIYIFKDIWQLAMFLSFVVMVSVAVGGVYWYSIQPQKMDGNFNIAVADFAAVGGADQDVADALSQHIFRFLDDEAQQITTQDIQVTHRNIPAISNAQEARDLARTVNAQVVIYGDVLPAGSKDARLTPQFYISEDYRPDVSELNGQQKLAAPILLPVENIFSTTTDSLEVLQERTVILTEFTKALVYLALNQLGPAQESVDKAIDRSQREAFEGKEVLYLFASQIARLDKNFDLALSNIQRALELNENYGRGYIALANIYYDQGDYYRALEIYRKADSLSNQPVGAYINQKASLGIGNICSVQFQSVRRSGYPDSSDVDALEQCSRKSYESVVKYYEQQARPEKNLKEMTARAYYGLGLLDQETGQLEPAQEMFEQTLELATGEELIRRAKTRLREVRE